MKPAILSGSAPATRTRSAALGALVLALVSALSVDALSQAKAPAKAVPAKVAPAKPAKGAAPKAAAAPAITADAGAPASDGGPSTFEVSTGWGDAGPPAVAAMPTARKAFPPPPPPSVEQVGALAQAQAEAATYEQSARDYRDAITRIVQHHYEDKRRRVLAALDGEIVAEKQALGAARDEAIKRLEEFVARYAGPTAEPEATPDAMFRLAALYEEKVRSETPEPDVLAQGLKPAVALYRRVIAEFPKYRELAGIYYYLGHALNDSSRIDEAQQVWRSLVCHNKFPYPVAPDPKDPTRDTIVRLPQDHDEDFWRGWDSTHTTPASLGAPKRPAKAAAAKAPKKGAAPALEVSDETAYLSPYPDACEAIAQKVAPGAEPRYLAEIWWQIGNYHFDQLDPHGGPFNLNRAATAYTRSMQWKKPPLFGVAMYKLAWTYFKQQRYETAVREFVQLLDYSDEQEKLTGDPGADFRTEAYTYIAGSLTYLDFQGPADGDPYITRTDVLDTESNPAVAEQKMHVAVERVQDARLIPQDKKWSVDVYRGLAQEYREVNQWHNAIETFELILRKWPMHRDAPQVQSQIAEIYDELTRLSREGTPEREQNAARALEARTRLASYVGNAPWVDANRDDPEAITSAERLVKGGLRRAAADHTNRARKLVADATSTSDGAQQKVLLDRALGEYKLADIGWTGYLRQDENAADAYETRFWIADARHGAVVVGVTLDRSPAAAEVAAARQAAVEVRDSNEDDRFLEPSAYYVVDLAEQQLQDQYRLFTRSNGTQGFEERKEAKFTQAADGTEKIVTDALPPAVIAAISARDEYVLRVTPAADTPHRAPTYSYQASDFFFLYGQWSEAQKRFDPMWSEHCGKDEWGYKAWDRLNTMAARSGDTERLRALKDSPSCAVSEADKVAEQSTRQKVGKGIAYLDAGKAYDATQKMAPGPERDKQWRKVAALYEAALQAGPDRDEAPEAAMNGAFAYKMVGEYDKAIAMYELFIKNYGDEKTLKKLDDEKSPKYAERVKYLKDAYETLSKSYVLFFNYRSAADTYDKISAIARFPEKDRRDATRNGLVLYSNMGDREKMTSMRSRLEKLSPSAQEKAEADFIIASSDKKQWDPRGADDGANKAARARATTAMMEFYDANRRISAADKYVVEAAYDVARMRTAASDKTADEWWKKTIAAFETYKSSAPSKDGKSEAMGSREAGFAAEAEYVLVDAEIRKEFDYETNHHRYAGTTIDVVTKYGADAVDAKKWQDKLEHVVSAYASPEWATAAIARQGTLYDSLRTGLYSVRAPALKLYDDKEEKLLKRFEQSDDPADQEKADTFRQRRVETWRAKRETELNSADEAMVHFYAQSVVLAKRYNVRNPAVNRANQRLAFFTDIIGEQKMRAYAQTVQGLEYRDSMFLQSRPGLIATPEAQPIASPLPAVP